MLVVVALGANALLQRGEPLDAEVQRQNVKIAARAISELARSHQVVVTHGNGPQVGLLALQSEAFRDVRAYPLDVLGAESEGMIGYLLEQQIGNEAPDLDVATLLTQVVVDAEDPGFAQPSKPVGPAYTEPEARRLADERGWAIAPDGDRWRRVVASPVPREIVELGTIELLIKSGVLVICAGGGGIPVVLDDQGALRGIEAVIDKDAAAALLAERLGADRLLLLTDVDAVATDWGTPDARAIRRASPDALALHQFASRSMGPKVDAACRFVRGTGRPAVIGALGQLMDVLNGSSGTTVTRDASGIEL